MAAIGAASIVAGASVRSTQQLKVLREIIATDGSQHEGRRFSQLAYEMSSLRSPAWLGAVAIWQSHPIVGAGTRSWSKEFPPIIDTEHDRFGIPPNRVAASARLPGAHNAYLEELAERGIVGFVLLMAVLVIAARTLWRQCPAVDAVMASALLAAWMTAALAESQSSQGVPTLLLCFVVARAAIPCAGTPR